ncbi:hypothetical protein [Corynebacterium variabile]|uniref:hypothetical protein n=1 Tax=Corynebacterium variabile TaxID=1727 RepID=UPI0028A97DDD|nr:hypothetical protein [Corynebacterium variabile]
MITDKTPPYRLESEHFHRCVDVIERSGVADLIETYYEMQRGSGGRPPSGRRYTLKAVLSTQLAIIGVTRVPSLAETHRVIRTLDEDQLVAVGMDPDQRDQWSTTSDYGAFVTWLTRRLDSVDPTGDLPAQRVTNREHREHLASRTELEEAWAELARQRLQDLMNAVIEASITIPIQEGDQAGRMVDESVIDLTRPGRGLGSRDDKYRGASPMGRYYMRDEADNSIDRPAGAAVRKLKKSGYGIGITAVSVCGPPENPTSVPAVITGAAVHHPTSGSLEGMRTAIEYHKKQGRDQRGPRARQPYLVVDMGYGPKRNFSSVCWDLGYAPVVRYPAQHRTVFASEGPEHTYRGVPAGPVQISGDFYCPVAKQVIGNRRLIQPTRKLQEMKADGFDQHDRLLSRLFPLLMGTNSRPYRKRAKPGRPQTGERQVEEKVRMDLVCPAVQGRVRCPLKPESMDTSDPEVPAIEPTWTADRYRCCAQSQLTVTLSDHQWRMAQWGGLVPGSWEHAIYHEAVRSATERQFSKLKSPHITGFEHLTWAPKREAMLTILIGLWIASMNMSTQDTFLARGPALSSTPYRWRQLEEDLGQPPTRIPPRT